MSRQTMATWFETHPKARARVEEWLHARRHAGGCSDGKATGIRTLIRTLKARHRFPFTEHTSLMRWIRREFGDALYTAATTKKAPVKFTASAKSVRALERSEDFIVTSAVNNCHTEPGFLEALERLREERGSTLVVNPVRYKNPQHREDHDDDEWWDERLKPYLLESPLEPHPELAILPTKIQATANNPLPPRISGFTRGRSTIFGHPQLAMRTIAKAPGRGPASIVYSSGAVTRKDYSDTVTGDVGDFHHTHSAVLAEIRGDDLFLREVTWDGHGLYDCERYYTPDGIDEVDNALLALVMGDVHVPSHDPVVMDATFEAPDSIYNTLHPDHLFLHDLSDAKGINGHDRGKQLTAALRAMTGVDIAEHEAMGVAQFLMELPEAPHKHVVPSNHDDFWMRWLEAGEKAVEPINRKLYHWLSHEMLDVAEVLGRFPNPLELLLRKKLGHPLDGVTFHTRDESLVLARDVEMLQHGDKGANGARGSAAGISRLAGKYIIGHTHSPMIWQGVYVAGLTGLMDQGYNVGPSGWRQSHVGQYRNGYRQMLHIVNGRWRG